MSEQSSNRFADSLRLFIDIARLRRGPEDLPIDRSVLAATMVAYGLLNLLLSQLMPDAPGAIVMPLLVDMAVALLWLALLLRWARKPERFLQTATAVFGFQLVVAPLFVAALALFARFQKDPVWQMPVTLLVMALGIWALVVNTRILRAATQWPMILCVALVMAEALVGRMTQLALFPEPVAAVPAS